MRVLVFFYCCCSFCLFVSFFPLKIDIQDITVNINASLKILIGILNKIKYN